MNKVSVDEILGIILYTNFGMNGVNNSDEYDSVAWNWGKMPEFEREAIERDLSIYLVDKLGLDNVC